MVFNHISIKILCCKFDIMAKVDKKKKRASKYENKLAIEGSFEDVIRLSAQPMDKPKEESKKKDKKK